MRCIDCHYWLALAMALFAPVAVPAADQPAARERSAPTGRTEEGRPISARHGAVAFSPDNQFLAIGHSHGEISICQVASGKTTRTLKGPDWLIRDVAWSPDGDRLAVAGGGKSVVLWNTRTWDIERTLTGHTAIIQSIAFSADGKTLASGGSDKTVRLWDVATGEPKQTFSQPGATDGDIASLGIPGMVYGVAISPDGTAVASGGGDGVAQTGELILWDAMTGKRRSLLGPNQPQIWAVAFSPDGAQLFAGAVDGKIKRFDVKTGRLVQQFDREGQLRAIAISPDGTTLAAGMRDQIKLWNLKAAELMATLPASGKWVSSLDFSRDGKLLAGSDNSGVRVWERTPEKNRGSSEER